MNILFDNLESLIDAPNGIEKARELILKLAVQGKLTQQEPKDEPASELLKKIKKGKDKLISEGKIKKQSELPPIKDEEKPFGLPMCWEWVRITDIATLKAGGDLPKNNFSKEKTDKYKVSIFANGEKNKGLFGFTDKPTIIEPSITISGRGTIGYSEIRNEPFFPIVRLIVLTPLTQLTDIVYLQYVIRGINFVNTGTSIPQLTVPMVKDKILIPIPPIAEQKRIVEKVNSLMALLDELEEKRERRNQKRIKLNNASLEKLLTSKDDKELKTNWKRIEENFSTLYSVPENVEKLKQAILQLAVQGKLVEQDPNDESASELLKKIKKEKEKLIAEGKIKKQNELPPIKDEEKPFELPKGWEWVRNGEILNELLGGFSYKSDSFIKSGKNQVLRLGNIRPSRLRLFENPVFISDELASETEKYSLKENDILITMTGTKGKRDYCYTVRLQEDKFEGRNLFLNQRVGCFRYNKSLYISFLDIVMKNDLILDLMYASSTGTANQANIGVTILNEILVPLPPLDEQKRIVEKVNELMSLCNVLEEKLTKKEATAEKLVGAVVNRISKGR